MLTDLLACLRAGWDLLIPPVLAQLYNGPGLPGGIDAAGGINGIPKGDIPSLIIKIVTAALNFISIIAVAVVIVAGVRLIVSMGSDDQKEKAKKSILYMAIGLAIIILSRVIVAVIVSVAQGIV